FRHGRIGRYHVPQLGVLIGGKVEWNVVDGSVTGPCSQNDEDRREFQEFEMRFAGFHLIRHSMTVAAHMPRGAFSVFFSPLLRLFNHANGHWWLDVTTNRTHLESDPRLVTEMSIK